MYHDLPCNRADDDTFSGFSASQKNKYHYSLRMGANSDTFCFFTYSKLRFHSESITI